MELTKDQKINIGRSLTHIQVPDEVKDTLLENGFYSPFHITAMSQRSFTALAQKNMRLGRKQAQKIYQRAQKIRQKAAHIYMNLRTTAGSPYYRALWGEDAAQRIDAEFVNVPGYQELFGSLDYVEGEDWNSMFGLAAYFVDIMRITDRYVTQPNDKTIPGGMKLKERRPDLRLLPLDRQHTQDQVPYLAVVNERLLELASRELHSSDPYREMASMVYPLEFPVNLPLEKIRIIMSQAGVPLQRIYGVVSGDRRAMLCESLEISPDSLAYLDSPLTQKQLADYYGTNPEELTCLYREADFLRASGISLEELYALLNQNLNGTDSQVAARFFINRGLPKQSYIQLKEHVLAGCDLDGLERMNRFIRTAGLLRLSFEQTDWLLQCLSPEILLDKEFFEAAMEALGLFKQVNMDFYDFFGLFGQMKTYGANHRFGQIFNRGSRTYHPAGAWNTTYTDDVIAWDTAQDTETASWLAGSMSVSMTWLAMLVKELFQEQIIPLTAGNLSLLYGHTAVLRALSMNMDEYLTARRLLASKREFSVRELERLLWLKTSSDRYGLTVYDLDFLVNAVVTPYVTSRVTRESTARLLEYMRSRDVQEGEEKEERRHRLAVESLADYFKTQQEVITVTETFFAGEASLEHWYDAFFAVPAQEGELSPYSEYIGRILLTVNQWLNVLETGIPLKLVKSIGENSSLYGVEDKAALTAGNWFDVYACHFFGSSYGDTQCLVADCAAFDEEGFRQLSGLTGWPAEQITRLLTGCHKTVAEKLTWLREYFSCMELLGVDIDYMVKLDGIRSIGLSDYDTLFSLEKDISNSLEIRENSMGSDCILLSDRDRLLSILCRRLDITEDELYKYLLIDIRMDEKTQISYIREGISAVQLYLQQCRMGFEPGIVTMEVEESWWSWVLDYHMWEANRRNYVYPENYLIPSVRHTKTDAFEEVESALQQSCVTSEYVEELYIRYLESAADRMEITVLAACERDKRLYLFGRTKKQPYVYYYCCREHTPVFSQWKEIEGCTIPAGHITPAVIFNKLYLFWTELKCIPKSIMIDSATVESKCYMLDVKYTYMDTQGRWAAPQDLISGEPVGYEENGKNPVDAIPLFKGVFSMEEDIWNRIGIIAVNEKNYAPFERKNLSAEKILAVYGAPLNSTAKAEADQLPLTASVSEGTAFLDRLRDIMHRAELLKRNASNGLLTAGFVKVFNSSLQEEYLIRKNEFIVMDEYAGHTQTAPGTPVADGLNRSFGTAPSPDTLRDMYSAGRMTLNGPVQMIAGDAFIMDGIDQAASIQIFNILTDKSVIVSTSIFEPPAVQKDALLNCDLKALLMDENQTVLADKPWLVKDIEAVLYRYLSGVTLLPAGIRSDAAVIPVTNHPGNFIIDNREETFLFTADERAGGLQYRDITDGITVSYPLTDACVFRTSRSISRDTAFKLISELVKNGLMDARHIPVLQNCTMERVSETARQCNADAQVVYNLVHNCPYADKDIFRSETLGIGQALSEKIYRIFEAEGMILENRVCLNLLYQTDPKLVFSELIVSGELKYSQLDGIYDCLQYAPIPVSVRYWAPQAGKPGAERYTLMRLSSGASSALKASAAGGLRDILKTDSQNHPPVPVLPFERYGVTGGELFNHPKASDGTAVDFEGLYGEYFWELFYHIPMLTGLSLKNQFNNDAGKRWFEYIFNPMNREATIEGTTFSDYASGYITEEQSIEITELLRNQGVIDAKGRVAEGFTLDFTYLAKVIPEACFPIVLNILNNFLTVPDNAFYWNFYPFRNHKPEEILAILSDSNPAVSVYNNDPYNPHAIARLRIGAYEKYALIQYIDNLLVWGDQKFMQSSWEAITGASMLYMMASRLLGTRPQMTGTSADKPTADYATIEKSYEDIPQFLIEIAAMCGAEDDSVIMNQEAWYIEDSTYFRVPENDELTRYWDTVEDRLFKLRNSLDINGNPRTIPLYGNRIDPSALARAAYSAQNMIAPAGYTSAAQYPYRFRFILEQARGAAGLLVSFGSQMLSALEKKDAETYMAMLTNGEKILMDMTSQIRECQIRELEEGLNSLKSSMESARHRLQYYEKLIAEDLSEGERKSLTASDTAFALSTAANVLKLSAGAAHALPQVGSPFAMTYGGIQVGSMLDSISSGMELGASIAGFISQRSLTMAGYERRKQEWSIQKDSIQYEITGIDSQLSGAAVRIESAQAELAVHNRSLLQKQETLAFLKDKFTGEELYQWMQGRMSTLMWQAYQLTMELAMGAQAAFWYELDSDRVFLAYEYWDSQKNGMLSGENLQLTMEQMQNEYLRQNQRRMEIEKHVSLALNCPEAFLELKSAGKCSFELTEAMFDYDYPGMYARKIISAAITIPALLGPYQSVHAVLTQTQNKVLIRPEREGLEYLLSQSPGQEPSSVRTDRRMNQSIALSKGIDDTGLISFSAADERYLPFEGTGAVSGWSLEMPKNTNLFDYNSITDVVLHITYTAKRDAAFERVVKEALNKYPKKGCIYYNLRQNFPLEWNSFMNAVQPVQELKVTIPDKLSYMRDPVLKEVWFKFDLSEELGDKAVYQIMDVRLPDTQPAQVEMIKDVGEMTVDRSFERAAGEWNLMLDVRKIAGYPFLQFLLKEGRLDPEHFRNVEMLLVYEGGF